MSKKINVVSLFGGIECGRVAMELLEWNVGEYFSIVHIGSVTDVIGGDYENIDILIGGSPCQDLSIAKSGGKGLEGEKSGLFYEYVRILHEVKPKYFLLENVASMKKADRDKISEVLGLDPVLINSSLVSAQNRKRLYWIGKLGEDGVYSKVDIPQPEDRGILLADILEDIPMDDERWRPLDEKYRERITDKMIEAYRKKDKAHSLTASYNGAIWWNTIERGQRSVVIGQFRRGANLRIHADQENSPTLTSNMGTGGNNVPIMPGLAHRNRGEGKAPECNGMEKANSMTTVQSDSEVLGIFEESKYYWRKLTPIECERLQTLPDGYTAHVSDSRRYKAIGNGWTVDVIAHILSHCKF